MGVVDGVAGYIIFTRGLGGNIHICMPHTSKPPPKSHSQSHTPSLLCTQNLQAQMKTDLPPEEMDKARQELLRELKAGQGSVKALAEDRVELVRLWVCLFICVPCEAVSGWWWVVASRGFYAELFNGVGLHISHDTTYVQ